MGFGGSSGGGNSIASSNDVALNNPLTSEVLTFDSLTSKWKNAGITAGNGVQARVWNGTAYPNRIAGATNLFIGPTDPGLLMDANADVWAGPSTTLDAVTAAALNSASDLNAAIKTATAPTKQFVAATSLAPVDNRPPSLASFSTTANTSSGLPAWMFPSGSNTVVGTLFETPAGWSKVRVRVIWSHNVASPTGSVQWLVRASPTPIGATLDAGGAAVQVTSSVPETKVIRDHLLNNVADVDPAGDLLRINIARLGSDDTFSGAAGLIGLSIERAA